MRNFSVHSTIIFVISAGFSFSQESRYQIIGGEDENFSWQEADAKAKTLSGHLATITSDEEMGIIARLLNDFERTTGIRPIPWIGGFEAGNPLEWRWVTGEPFTYTNWYIGLTTINPPGDDEIYLQTGSSGWQFYPQNRGRGRSDYFILEKPPVDTDGDGLDDSIETNTGIYVDETNTGTNPNLPDTDGDGLGDSVETNTGTYLNETNTGTNPNIIDSDDDGIGDGTEIKITLTDPSKNSIAESFGYSGLLSDFDGGGVDYTTASINGGRPGEINDLGPDGNYYRLLFGTINSTSNYLSFDSTKTSGWSKATLSFDVRADNIVADGFSINFLDVKTHESTGVVQAGAGVGLGGGDTAEEQARIWNSIGVGFITFNGTKATVWNGKNSSVEKPFNLPAGEWGNFSITIEKDDSGNGSLSALGSFNGQTETIFDNYDLGSVTLDEFRVQIMGRTGGSSMELDLDNVLLSSDVGGAEDEGLPEFEERYVSEPNQTRVIDGSIVTDDPGRFIYQWFFNGELIPADFGGNDPVLNLKGLVSEAGDWKLLISDQNNVVEKSFTHSIAAPPVLSLESFYESPPNERLVIDVDTFSNNQSGTTYQWYFNGFPIPENFGGNLSSFTLEGIPGSNGLWKVVATNTLGEETASFQYRVIQDTDSDGLSDGYEEFVSQTNINNPDTDNDGLGDADEVNTYRTNPNSPDSDSDGFTDLYELETAYDPNSAESVPDALVEIMTAIEVKFNAALGATYAIEFSTDNQAWDVIEDDIVGEGGAIERLYSKQEYPTGFFRVERKDQ
ncbi:hypothetical protein N9Z69_01175 [bacterium]|nr:hypothetical protein [bacterium]